MANVKEIIGKEVDPLSSAETYEVDKPLIEKLGLKTFKKISPWKKIRLGIVKFTDVYEIKVVIIVEPAPAQFFKFNVSIRSPKAGRFISQYNISTGSGNFTEYWEILNPLFKRMSKGMIVIEKI